LCKKLKIGFDAKRLFNNNTGLGNYSRTLVRNLVENYPEHEYHLFTPKIGKHSFNDYFLSDRFVVHTPSAFQNGNLWRSIKIPDIVKKFKLDIYHGLSHELPLIKLPSNCHSVCTFHDLIFELFPEQFSFIDNLFFRLKYRRSARNADLIIAISESTKADMLELYHLNSDKVKVVYQSYNQYFNTSDVRPFEDRKYFLFVGSLIQRKGVHLIIDAYLHHGDSLPAIKIIGGGKGTYAKDLKEKVEKNNLSHKIQFIGSVSNEQLKNYYQNAIATLLPAIYEGFGIPIVESLATGTPVVISSYSSLPEAAGPGAEIMRDYTSNALYDAMMQMLNPGNWQDKSSRGHSYVTTQFDGNHLSNQLMHIYRDLLK